MLYYKFRNHCRNNSPSTRGCPADASLMDSFPASVNSESRSASVVKRMPYMPMKPFINSFTLQHQAITSQRKRICINRNIFFIDIQLQFRWVGCIGFFGTIVEADQELTRQQRVGYRKLRFASIFFSSGTTESVKANRTPSNGVSVILES